MSQEFSRRRFLRGLGTLMALPALEATAPFAARAATAAKTGAAGSLPLRMAFVYTPNGKNMEHWTPGNDGSSYDLSPSLWPLKELKSEFQVISGLKHEKAQANGDGGGDHARANASTNINTTATGLTVQTAGGPILFNANVTGLGGSIDLDRLTVLSNGGNITLGGGLNGTDYAVGTATSSMPG